MGWEVGHIRMYVRGIVEVCIPYLGYISMGKIFMDAKYVFGLFMVKQVIRVKNSWGLSPHTLKSLAKH